MENIFNDISNAFIILITVGITTRLAFCFIKIMTCEENEAYKVKAKNAIVFLIIAWLAFEIKDLIFTYYEETVK